MTESNIGSGDVEINLGGKELLLKPTLKACIFLSGAEGGISALANKCASLDFNSIKMVIEQGLGFRSKDMQETIFRSGLINLSTPCITFLHVIANGGKMPGDDDDKGDEEKEAPLVSNSL